MEINQKTKVFFLLICIVGLIILFRNNIEFKKEVNINNNSSQINLELNSNIVGNLYKKLILLDNDEFKDDIYKDLYFDFENSEKTLSNEDMLYIAFNSIYKDNLIKTQNEENGITLLSVDVSTIKTTIKNIFDVDFNPLEVNFKSSLNCGIVEYLYTGEEYKIKVKKCENGNIISKNKLVSAVKDGDYIFLRIKSFKAHLQDDESVDIINYSHEILGQVNTQELESVYDNFAIDEYEFLFLLNSDEYYLKKVRKV